MRKAHDFLNLIPVHDEMSYLRLKEDIKVNGILQPVHILEPTGEILDGRARLKIADELGLGPIPTIWIQDAKDVLPLVMSNVHRRHLTKAQMALVLALVAERTEGKTYAAREKAARNLTGITTTHVGPTTAQRGAIVAKKDPQKAKELIRKGGKIPLKELSGTLTPPGIGKMVSDAASYLRQAENLMLELSRIKNPELTMVQFRNIIDIQESVRNIEEYIRDLFPTRRKSNANVLEKRH